MPDMKLAYIVTNVGNGNKFLSDSMEFVPLALSQQNGENLDGARCDLTTMPTEVFIVGLGSYGRRPILFIRTKVDLLIYQVCDSYEIHSTNVLFNISLSIRFTDILVVI